MARSIISPRRDLLGRFDRPRRDERLVWVEAVELFPEFLDHFMVTYRFVVVELPSPVARSSVLG